MCFEMLLQLCQLRAAHRPLPDLFCVPVLVKDNFDTVGMTATAGSVGLADNFAAQNAFVARHRLDHA